MLALLLFAASFTDQLWTSITTIYAQTLEHPFLKGLSAGTLPKDRFRYYLIQDVRYLGSFAGTLRALAEKAPRESWAATLHRHAEETETVERQLHDSVLASYGVTREEAERAEMAPVNYAYTNHLMAAASRGSFAEGLAAVLPCYWIYWEVGKELQKRGSRNADYKRWIEQYAGQDYSKAVQEVLDMMNAESNDLTRDEQMRAIELFVRSARYEYMFWDMAWRLEQWPPAAPPAKR